jgi:hypothetical protein
MYSSRTGKGLAAAILALPLAAVALPGTLLAQEAWRGLNVPSYPNASDYNVETDEDEYEIRFRSQDDVQAVFDFYRDYLQQQGFQVADSRPTSHGFKADLTRGQGGPDDSIELDAKLKHGRYKVEIEFDE